MSKPTDAEIIEWAALKLSNKAEEVGPNAVGWLRSFRKRLMRASKLLRQIANNRMWISVAESLPGHDDFVLVCDMETSGYLPDRGVYEDGKWHVSGDPEFVVTHWMEIPPPPKANQ
jgi:hypothetical protein